MAGDRCRRSAPGGLRAGDRRHRPLRADARRRSPRRRWTGSAQCDSLERRTFADGVRGTRSRCGRAGADRQPGHAGLHGTEAALGAPARTPDVRTDAHRPPAQGLPALPHDGRVRERHVRCIGHAHARCRRTGLFGPYARRDGPVAFAYAAIGGRLGSGGRTACGCRPGVGNEDRARGGRCGRPSRGRGRRRRSGGGCEFPVARYFGSLFRARLGLPTQPAGRGPCFLPRASRHVAPDVGDPVRRQRAHLGDPAHRRGVGSSSRR